MKQAMRLFTAAILIFGLTLTNTANVRAQAASDDGQRYVIPCGTPFGVKLYTEGVVVIDTEDIVLESGRCCPAEKAGIKPGDIIYSVDGEKITSNTLLSEIISNSGGKKLSLVIIRDGKQHSTSLTPVITGDNGECKAGLWIRDSCAGIGTMTFYDPQTHVFAALGHGICDVDTKKLLPCGGGEIVKSRIDGVTKGVKGIPGGLDGCFTEDEPIGKLILNTDTGVYGTLDGSPVAYKALPVANRNEVKTGAAEILSTVDGEEPKSYGIRIASINNEACSNTKNMVIEIDDGELLDKTGGIVQGMSGSPIIQNGKIVGAVTHVFINDPTKGYAILAETMLNRIALLILYINAEKYRLKEEMLKSCQKVF